MANVCSKDAGILHLVRFSIEQAVYDLRHDYRLSVVLLVSIASILAPLLLLFGLKTGVVSTMKQKLLDNPVNLEIVIYQNARLDSLWFDTLRAREDVAFVIPRTRTINATIRIELPKGFQTSEFLLEHGFIDRIVPRSKLKSEIARTIDYCGK